MNQRSGAARMGLSVQDGPVGDGQDGLSIQDGLIARPRMGPQFCIASFCLTKAGNRGVLM